MKFFFPQTQVASVRVVAVRPSNSDNYRFKHVNTGKVLDPTNVDKLVRVEPWRKSDQPNYATNQWCK